MIINISLAHVHNVFCQKPWERWALVMKALFLVFKDRRLAALL